MSTFNKTVLDNGLRIITVPKTDSLATTVLVMVEAGSDYETKEINGISHFLEHMCFKGTEKRPKSIDITNELNNIGSQYNAFTWHEYTGYYAKAQNIHTDKLLDLVSDIYLNPVFDVNEMEKEKGVVVEEINMYEDRPDRKVHDLFSALLYGDQPAGWDIAGTKETVRSVTRDALVNYRSQHYVANATTIVVAGGLDKKEVLGKIQSYFSRVSTGEKSGRGKTGEKQEKPALRLGYKKSDQTHLVMGVRAFNLFDERRFALEILGEILGGGFGSRLFEKIRSEMGAAYYVGAGATLLSDRGYLAAFAGIDHAKLMPVVHAVVGECKKLAEEQVTTAELERCKNKLSGHLILDLETSDSLASYYGGQEILKEEIMAPEELLVKIRAVTAEQIQEVARDVFQNNKLNFAMIGPHEDEKRIGEVLYF